MRRDLESALVLIKAAELDDRWDDAAELWQQVIKEDPKPQFLLRYGVALQNLGQLEDAETTLRESIAKDSTLAEAHFRLGILLEEQERLTAARGELEAGLDIEEDQSILNILGSVLRRLGDMPEAESRFARSLELDGQDPEAHFGLGMALKRIDPPRAVIHLNEALHLDPDLHRGHRELGHALWYANQRDEAEKSLGRAVAADPSDAWAHDYLGHLLRERGELEMAKAEFRAAAEADERVGFFRSNLAEVCAQLGESVEADRWFRDALSKDPADPLTNLKYGQFLRQSGRPEKAAFYLQRSVDQDPDDQRAITALEAIRQAKP